MGIESVGSKDWIIIIIIFFSELYQKISTVENRKTNETRKKWEKPPIVENFLIHFRSSIKKHNYFFSIMTKWENKKVFAKKKKKNYWK